MNSQLTLYPHQQALLREFFRDNAAQDFYLQAPPGMGKASALSALVAEQFERKVSSRVLFLAPMRVLIEQYAHRVADLGVPSSVVDAYRFRSMLDAGQTNPWAPGVAYAVTLQAACRDEMLRTILDTQWDLLICEQPPFEPGSRTGHVVQQIRRRANRAIFTDHYGEAGMQHVGSDRAINVIHWRKEDLAKGRSGANQAIPTFQNVIYDREGAIAAMVEEISAAKAFDGPARRAFADSLISSPAAFEQAVLSGEVAVESAWQDERASMISLPEQARTPLEEVLRKADEAATDEKIGVLLELVRASRSVRKDAQICIVTRFVASAYYISSALEAEGYATMVATSSADPAGREHALRTGPSAGMILVATRGTLSWGPNLPQVTDLIFYEPIAGSRAAALVVDHANSLDRSEPLSVFVITTEQQSKSSPATVL